MELYNIVRQLTEPEFEELLRSFEDARADKSAAFLKTIRKTQHEPEKEFLKQYDISASAFYVLKSRLNQKVEEFLVTHLGDKNLDVISRVFKANEKVFENSRQMSIGALNQLEKELLRLDFPYGLMTVYKLLQNLHIFDTDKSNYYQSEYKKQVAYTLAIDNAQDCVMQFFKSFDNYLLSRKEEDFQQILRLIEKIDNLCNLYDSHRLFLFKSIVHLFGLIFLDITNEPRCEMESPGALLEKAVGTLNLYPDEVSYQNLHLLFNFLLYGYWDKQGSDKAMIYYEILDYKIEEMLTRYYLNAQMLPFLFSKIRYHVRTKTEAKLQQEAEKYLSNIHLDTYRPAHYIYYQLFLAKTAFVNGQYAKSNKILYALRNAMSFRRYPHVDLEIKFLMTIGYIMTNEWKLAEQFLKTIQRQLRNEEDTHYDHCRILNKILTVAAGNRSNTRRRNLEKYVPEWNKLNKGRFAMLTEVDMHKVFLVEFDRD